jgi:hypothetical protein
VARLREAREFKTRIKAFLPLVSHIPHFLPEIARRIGSRFFTKALEITRDNIRSFAEHPIEVLDEILRGLSHDNRAVLALIFMNGGSVPSPVDDLTLEERTAIERLGGTLHGVLESLTYLNGSLVKLERTDGLPSWTFKHPTIRDAFATLVSVDPELLDIYLTGTPFDRMMDEVTCGNIGLAGVKVVIPESRFNLIAKHLDVMHASGDIISLSNYYTFLGLRCSGDFLRFYLRQTNGILQELVTCGVLIHLRSTC